MRRRSSELTRLGSRRQCRLALLFVLGVFGLGHQIVRAQTPPVTLDLRHEAIANPSGFNLMPNWEIYWGQLLSPEEISQGKGQVTEVVSQESFIANRAVLHQGSYHNTGFLTIRTRIRLPPSSQSRILNVPRLGSPYKLWLDGVFAGGIGQVSNSPELSRPSSLALPLELPPRAENIEIVMQLSNFSAFSLGVVKPLQIFESQHYQVDLRRKFLLDFLLIGTILIMGFYHFALYIIRRSEPAALYFGLFCFFLAARITVMSDGFCFMYRDLFSAFPYRLSVTLEMFGFTIGVATFLHFMVALYPKEIIWFNRVLVIWSFHFYSLIVILTQPAFYSKFVVPYQLLVIIATVFNIYSIVLAIRRQRNGARIFLVGLTALFVTLVNDILYDNGVIDTFQTIPFGLFIFILCQSILLARRFARDFEQMTIVEKTVRNLNDELEAKVSERTQTIRVILDNVRSGFLMVDRDIRIATGFTESCREILGPKIEVDMPLGELLELKGRERSQLELALKQVFADSMPEDATLAQIPSRYKMGKKVIGMQASVIRDASGQPESILLSLSDVSNLARAEDEVNRNRSLLKIIREKASFVAFIQDAFATLKENIKLTERGEYKQIAMDLHTLKGNFALYGLDSISRLIHKIEDQHPTSVQDIHSIELMIIKFIQNNAEILGLEAHALGNRNFEVTGSSLQKLQIRLQQATISRTSLEIMQKWINEVRKISVNDLLGPVEGNVERVASLLRKQVRLVILGSDLRVDPYRLRIVFKNLIHIVLNSLDHGIECPDERGEKSEVGLITLNFAYDQQGNLKITIADDGKGLGLELIRKHALEKALVTQKELDKMSTQQIHELIFCPGFSTRSIITEYSGRGVGMSSLMSAVKSLNGNINLTSKAKQGTTIEINIPPETTADLISGTA